MMSNYGRLKDKVAIITGASKGIGAGMAVMFAKEGAKVVIIARTEDKLLETARNVEQIGGEVLAVTGDLALEATWQRVVDETLKRFGKIDILINNCGVHIGGYAENTTMEEWDTTMACNLTSYFLGIHYVIPEMKKTGKGSIVNVSSVAGLKAGMCTGWSTPYAVSKHANMGLTKEVAQEVAGSCIRCNTLCPGGTKTSMGSISEEFREKLRADHPLPPHINSVDDVCYAALFLASDESACITGAHLAIDCGQSSK